MDSLRLKGLSEFACDIYEEWAQCAQKYGVAIPDATKGLHEILTRACFRLGLVGNQGAGKTTLVNTLLCFPYLPSAQIATTGCLTNISYAEKMEITLLSSDASQIHSIDLDSMSRTLFADLKRYVEEYLLSLYNITSLYFFTDPIESDDSESKHPNGRMLHMDYGDIRCRAALVLHLLQTYVDQNILAHDSPDYLKAVNRERKRLLCALGVHAALEEYTIRFAVNCPLLKEGLELVDLPGSGSIVKAGNGWRSQDDLMREGMKSCDAILLLIEPSLSRQTLFNLDLVLEELRSRGDGSSTADMALIPVLNKMDIPGATGCQSKIDIEFSKRKLKATYSTGVIRISAKYAEKRIYNANPDLPLAWSMAAQVLSKFKVDDAAALIRQVQDRCYEQSGFDLLLSTLEDVAAKAREFACTQLLRDIRRLYIPFLLECIEQLKRQKRRLKNEASLLLGLNDMIKDWEKDGPPRMAGRFADACPVGIWKIAKEAGKIRLCEESSPYYVALKAIREKANQKVLEIAQIVMVNLVMRSALLPGLFTAVLGKYIIEHTVEKKKLESFILELSDCILAPPVFDETYARLVRSYVNASQDTTKAFIGEWDDHINQLRHSNNCARSRAECFLGQLGDRKAYSQEAEALAWKICDAFFEIGSRFMNQLDAIVRGRRVQAEDEQGVESDLNVARKCHDKVCNGVRKQYIYSCNALRERLFAQLPKDVTIQSLMQECLDEGEWSSFQEVLVEALSSLKRRCQWQLERDLEQIIEAARFASQQAQELQLAIVGDYMDIRRKNEEEIRRLEGILSTQVEKGRLPYQDRPYPEIAEILRLFLEVRSKAAKAMMYND